MRSPSEPNALSAWLLSNGRYHVVVSAAGGCQSRWQALALNRWNGDPLQDDQGWFLYLRDLASGQFWSASEQPVRGSDPVQATYAPASVTLTRTHDGIETSLEIAVSPEDDLEVRRLRVRNTSAKARRIEVTSYLELVLNYPAADAAHPAFSKLFVETEIVREARTLLAHRRPRGNDEHWPWLFHTLAGTGEADWESDRMRFIGRGGSMSRPRALRSRDRLSGSAGSVLDAAAGARTTLSLTAGGEATLTFLTGVATDRAGALALAKSYADESRSAQAFTAARMAEHDLWATLQISEDQAEKFQALGGAMTYACRSLRAPHVRLTPDADIGATYGRFGIPRDRPTTVVLGDWNETRLAEIVTARKYWGAKGLYTNLIVVTRHPEQKQPDGLDDRVFTLAATDVSADELDRLKVASHWVVDEGAIRSTGKPDQPAAAARATPARKTKSTAKAPAPSAPRESLLQFNGYGGFSADGSEYVVSMPWHDGELRWPPLPWINVIANEHCGFLVSESGAGYTWCRNSQANRLTPWSNDPVTDPHGEAFYVRDDTSGEFWSPLPGPAPAACGYEARHGFGYSRFTCTHQQIEHETTFFVPRSDLLRIVRVRLTNRGAKARKLSLYSYHRLALGERPEAPSLIATDRDDEREVLLARNCRGNEFRGGITFAAIATDAPEEKVSFTCDRAAFVGGSQNEAQPAAVREGAALGGEVGAGLDPCLAQRLELTLAPQQTVDCAFLLGECLDQKTITALVERYREPGIVDRALDEVREDWRNLLTGIRVETPVPGIDLMVNGWLGYQVLGCRIWGRSAFYQSGGAYGYRDQIQDALALVHLRPELTRAQILLHARHQLAEGDVLHWWHPPPIDRGLRTRFSDDLLWLPYVTAEYVMATGDSAILREAVPFLEARLLNEGEDEAYLDPKPSADSGDVFEHCCRAIDRSLTRGPHGIPLMGTGDWNDGMNRVGRGGRGESVWLGFFLHHILNEFLPIVQARGDKARAERYAAYRADLANALNEGGWDGEWYRRAYYDDGTPLGSKQDDECKIDAIAQAWAVISDAAPRERADAAIDALEKHLISDRDGIIRLLTPPFVNTPHDPGYIKGYVAGVRENGGQYTHGACWAVRAVAELGRNNRAAQLLTMLSPVHHTATKDAVDRYKLEPYAMGADVYGAPPHVGRGGWSWYTGSAGWMYRVAVESILGLKIENGDTLVLAPCVPDDWPGYRMTYRHPGSGAVYQIEVENPNRNAKGVVSVELDGQIVDQVPGPARIALAGDAASHTVKITLG